MTQECHAGAMQLSKGYNSKAIDYHNDSVYCQTSTDAMEIYLPLFFENDVR